MKSIYFNEDHELFRQTVRQFMETEVAPHAEAWERDRRIPREIWKRMADMGFLGILFPERYGGAGADIFFAAAFLEELARSLMGGFVAAVTVQEFIATGAIYHQGTEEQRQRYLVPSIEGTKVGAICISEPDAGSDVAAMTTRAVRDGDDWVINGAKTWITNGCYADFYVVTAKTDKDAGAGGISLIVVDGDTPGVGTSKLRKMGLHSSDTAEVSFDNVRVPASNLVGREGMGFYYIMDTFVIERLSCALTSLGACDVALEMTLKYMSEREAFGRPINKFQALRHRLADLFTEVEAARALTHHTCWLYEQGENPIKESSMAKMLTSELQKKVADECLQFFGGFGYVEEYPIERLYRDARVGTIVAGTTEIMREIIAKITIDGMKFKKLDERQAEAPAPAPAAPKATASEPAQAGTATLTFPTTVAELFRSLPQRFRADKAAELRCTVQFKFTGSPTPEWTVTIADGECRVAEGLEGQADCVVTTTEALYLGIERGTESPEGAFFTGKIKLSNPPVMMKYMKAFRPFGK